MYRNYRIIISVQHTVQKLFCCYQRQYKYWLANCFETGTGLEATVSQQREKSADLDQAQHKAHKCKCLNTFFPIFWLVCTA